MAECENCGSEVKNKNKAGHFRSKCFDCIEAEAERDLSTNPYHNDDTI